MKNDLLKKITCRYCKNKYCECDFEEALKKSIEMINKDYINKHLTSDVNSLGAPLKVLL